jgi:hypothetical protein
MRLIASHVAPLLWAGLGHLCSRPAVVAWLLRRALRTPYTPITAGNDPASVYMNRWWLFNPYDGSLQQGTMLRRWSWCPISVRVHHILRPDADRHLHDHPWNARTIILRGGYTELRQDGPHTRRAGETVALRFGEYHRITQVAADAGALTLFITGRYRGTWGFLVDGAKVPYRRYLGLPDEAGG